MATHRRADAAGLAHEVWQQLCALAEQNPGEFTPETSDGDPGWLWEGAPSGLVSRAAPDTAQDDLQLAREYLKTSGMLVNVRGRQSGGTQPTYFIRREWHAERTGNVRVIPDGTPHPPERKPGPRPAAATAGTLPEDLSDPVKDLQSRADRLAAENARLQDEAEELAAENARLRAENNRLRAAARKVTKLLAEFQDLASLRLRLGP
ncbi:MAG: hypothetical protein LBI49_17120 [Nocardiopsaceae bacterium]|jgi:FtsZ-binding cell division protein ZapB|nr:hypothetical protein [Nocardiopsaceae bacterium]